MLKIQSATQNRGVHTPKMPGQAPKTNKPTPANDKIPFQKPKTFRW
jgi:hypothetical protein